MSAASPDLDDWLKGKPYPGLRPYTFEESYLFFGRDDICNQLLDRLSVSRFLAVIGESGCGKSSLVRAGMLPDLQIGFMPGAKGKWRIATMKPGYHPFENLAKALGRKSAFGPGCTFEPNLIRCGLLDFLSTMESTNQDTGRPILPNDTNLLILVDQFEEIFRYFDIGNTDEAEGFVSLLLDLAEQQLHSIYIIITMRTDFLGDCAKFYGLPEAINQGQFLVPRLSKFQLRQAIVEPARVKDCKVEEKLVNRLLEDVGPDPDYLPLVQHALMRLYDHRKDNTLTLDAYKKLGGIERTLSNHADGAYNKLKPEQQQLAETLFRCLSSREESHRKDTRNPSKFGEIAKICAPTPGDRIKASEKHLEETTKKLKTIINIFRDPSCSFITPPAPEEIKLGTVLDISHENLIRQWTKMCGDPKKEGREKEGWVKLEAKKRRTYASLADDAQFWRENGKKRADLAKVSKIAQAKEWIIEERPSLAWAIYNNSYLAWKADASIGELHKALITTPRDEAASAQYQEKLNAWCKDRFDLTLEWLEKSKNVANWKHWGLILSPLIITIVITYLITKGLAYRDEKKMLEYLDRARHAETSEKAVMAYKKALALGDTSFETYNELADIHLSEQRPDEAIAYYERFLDKNPRHFEAKLNLARVYVLNKHTVYANRLYKQILDAYEGAQAGAGNSSPPTKLNPIIKQKAIGGKLEIAFLALKDGHHDLSIEILKQVVNREPENPQAFLGLGNAFSQKKDFKKARNHYEKIRKENGSESQNARMQDNYISAQLGLGDICINQNLYPEAIEHYKNVLKRDHSHLIAHIGLFSVYFRQGKYSLAKRQYNKILGICLDNSNLPSQVRIYMSSLLLQYKDYQMAITLFDMILKEGDTPNRLPALLGLGTAYHRQKKYDEAIHLYKSALKEKYYPNDVFIRIGSSYLANHNYSDAEKAFGNFINAKFNENNSSGRPHGKKIGMRQNPEKGAMVVNEVAYAWIGKGYAQKAQDKNAGAEISFKHAAENDTENNAFQIFNQRNNIKKTEAVTREAFIR